MPLTPYALHRINLENECYTYLIRSLPFLALTVYLTLFLFIKVLWDLIFLLFMIWFFLSIEESMQHISDGFSYPSAIVALSSGGYLGGLSCPPWHTEPCDFSCPSWEPPLPCDPPLLWVSTILNKYFNNLVQYLKVNHDHHNIYIT